MNTRAELKLTQNDAKASLEDLRLCYRLAVANDKNKLKLGELLLNMAQASSLSGTRKEAIHFSGEAVENLKEYIPGNEEDLLN